MLNHPVTRTGEPDAVPVELLALQRLGYDVEPEIRSGGGGGVKPTGHVRVWDNADEIWEPLKGVRVKVNSRTKIDLNAYTNEEGYYQTSKKFWQKNLNYTVVFHNSPKDFWIWEGLGNRAKYKHGSHSKYGCDIDISDTEGSWKWAATNNAAWDYYEMCNREGIDEPPSDLKIWVQPNNEASSASMIRRVKLSEIGVTLPVTGLVFNLLGLKPDLTIGTSNANYSMIYYAVNHELSHASHFSVVGSTYWAGYINYIIHCFIWGHTTYGNGRGQNAGVCEVGEMWGHAMGHIEECELYDTDRWENPYFSNFGRPGDDGWIHPDPIWALITRGVLTKKQVFDSMTSDVDTVDKWIAKLCSMYPTQAEAIGTAFAANDVPTVIGPDKPAINTNAAYSVPAAENMPADVEFTGWTVTPASGYTTTGGLAGRTINIRFTAEGNYTLAANFTLPDGTDYSASKTISITDSFSAPVITVGRLKSHHYLTVANPVAGATYQWTLNGKLIDARTASGTYLIVTSSGLILNYDYIPLALPLTPTSFSVKCRAMRNGLASGWSDVVVL